MYGAFPEQSSHKYLKESFGREPPEGILKGILKRITEPMLRRVLKRNHGGVPEKIFAKFPDATVAGIQVNKFGGDF